MARSIPNVLYVVAPVWVCYTSSEDAYYNNRLFPSASVFKTRLRESSCKTFFFLNKFDLHENELVDGNHFHMNNDSF